MKKLVRSVERIRVRIETSTAEASYSTASRSKISSGSVVLRMPKIEIGRVQKLGA